MAEKPKHNYDESKITTLSSLEHIRLRTGMYIGRIGNGSHYDDGCYILLKEVIDNAIDEYIMGFGKEVELKIEGTRVSVRDFGRGIPLGKVVDCVSTINTGAKYNETDFKPEHVERRLRHYSYVNTGLKLILRMKSRTGVAPVSKSSVAAGTPQAGVASDGDRRDACPTEKVFQSRHGLMDLVMEDLASDGSEPIYPPLHYASKMLEFCFTHSNSRYGETFYSFVNGQYTADGGTHLSAFREGLLKAVNEYGNRKYEGDDVRECMVGAVAIRLKDPVFESQTKNKLGNTEIRTELVNRVREELLHFFQRNKAIAEQIITKVKDTQQLRKELQEVKKLARERAKAITLRIPQLKDCKNHFDRKKEKGKGTMVFICEGQSAAGSITSCRDVK